MARQFFLFRDHIDGRLDRTAFAVTENDDQRCALPTNPEYNGVQLSKKRREEYTANINFQNQGPRNAYYSRFVISSGWEERAAVTLPIVTELTIKAGVSTFSLRSFR
jgi:hypothetical protein